MTLPSPELVLNVQLIPTAAMFGIIWMSQLVTYPCFLSIDSDRFVDYHRRYTRRIALVVIPLMLAELGMACLSAWQFWGTSLQSRTLILLSLAAAAWLITLAFQVPLHTALGAGYSDSHIRKLIATNWLRTGVWTVRLALLASLIWQG